MSQSKVTTFYKSRKKDANLKFSKIKPDEPAKKVKSQAVLNCCIKPAVLKPEEVEDVLNRTYTISDEKETATNIEIPKIKTPKRSHSENEAGCSDSKKKKNDLVLQETKLSVDHSTVRRKLILTEDVNCGETSAKEASETQVEPPERKVFANFLKVDQKLANFQSNKCKITSVIVPAEKKTDAEASKDTAEEVKPVLANVKYASLCLKGESHFTLPNKYLILLDTFSHLDFIVSLMYNRKETCTFGKLKKGVENVTKKCFTQDHLARIKAVYPTSYDVTVEKTSVTERNRNPGTPPYQLIIMPNLKDLLIEDKTKVSKLPLKKGTDLNVSPVKKQKSSVVRSPSKYRNGTKTEMSMTPAALTTRKQTFSDRLLSIVHKHHQIFLSSLNSKINILPNKLTKWHPKFKLDQIPDIEPAKLPELPNQQKAGTAKEFLEKIRGIHGERVEKALEKVAKKYEPVQKTSESNLKDSKVKDLKGIDSGLLQRIRAREAAKLAEDMMLNPIDKKRREMLERVPEFVRNLRVYFIIEKKAAISIEDASKKLSESYHTSISRDQVEKHIKFMAEIFPEWLKMLPARNTIYLKIDKNMDINVMLKNMPAK